MALKGQRQQSSHVRLDGSELCYKDKLCVGY